MFLESRNLQPAQRELAKASELHMQAPLARLLGVRTGLSGQDASLLAAHCMSLAQDWHLKRWEFGAADISADAFAASVMRLVCS